MNCGKNIRDDAKFCQFCGSRTVIAEKGSAAGETVPDYPGSEYTIVYSPDGTGESRVEEISSRTGYPSNRAAADGRGYQSGNKSADVSDGGGFYASQPRPVYGSNPGSPQAAGAAGGYAQTANRAGGYAQTANGAGGYAQAAGAAGGYAQAANGAGGYAQAAGAASGYAQAANGADGYASAAGAAGGYAQAANGSGEYTRDMGAMGSYGSHGSNPEAADMSKVFNSPVLGVAGLKEENPGSEQNAEVKSDKKGSGILIAIIVILILLILLVGFAAFAYIQGLIEF